MQPVSRNGALFTLISIPLIHSAREANRFSEPELLKMLALARGGVERLVALQKAALG